jgi:hypothetical protein
LDKDKPQPNYYSGDREATVPTPPDQQDVSPLDMVSEAVEEMMDIIRDDMGLKDAKTNQNP